MELQKLLSILITVFLMSTIVGISYIAMSTGTMFNKSYQRMTSIPKFEELDGVKLNRRAMYNLVKTYPEIDDIRFEGNDPVTAENRERILTGNPEQIWEFELVLDVDINEYYLEIREVDE